MEKQIFNCMDSKYDIEFKYTTAVETYHLEFEAYIKAIESAMNLFVKPMLRVDEQAALALSMKTAWNLLQWSMCLHKWKPVGYDFVTFERWYYRLKNNPLVDNVEFDYERRKQHDVESNRVWEIERDREAQPRRRRHPKRK